MEHYGDVHLHHAKYPNNQGPQSCGTQINYEHANLCGSTPYGTSNPPQPGVEYRNGHAYDCGCNLCQAPYSVPYATGPGGFMGDMLQYRACKHPYCKCTDCDGNCKCGASAAASIEGFMNFGDNSVRNLLLLGGVGALAYYVLYNKE